MGNGVGFTESQWGLFTWPKSRLFVNLNLGWLRHAVWQSNLRAAGYTGRWTEIVNARRLLRIYSAFASELAIWHQSRTLAEIIAPAAEDTPILAQRPNNTEALPGGKQNKRDPPGGGRDPKQCPGGVQGSERFGKRESCAREEHLVDRSRL